MKNYFLLFSFFFSSFTGLYNISAQTVETIAGTGTGGYNGDNILAISAELNRPDAIRFDHSGNLFIIEEFGYRVRKINSLGVIITVAGNGTSGYSGDGEQATNAQLNQPIDLMFDTANNLYIADIGSIRKVTADGIITTIAGTGVMGEGGDGGSAVTAQVYDPFGLQFDNQGNLYFSDNFQYRIRKISTAGIITTIAGTGNAGYSGDNGSATLARIDAVGYMTIGPDGNLYIPDYGHWVRRIDLASGIITTVAGNGASIDNGDGGPATAAGLAGPTAVIFDHSDNMYISDGVGYMVRKVNASGTISTVAGNGTHGYSGDGGAATAAQFNGYMNCSAVDAYGNLYIADPENNRIRKVFVTPEAVNNIANTQNTVSIFPNPASNEVTINATDKIENIEVINLIGQVVTPPGLPQREEVLLNVADLPNGIYFVKVNGVYAGKFVKE